MARREPADPGRDDRPDAPVGLLLRLLLDAADQLRHVVADVVLRLLEQLLAGLLLGHPGGALELAHGRLARRLQLLLERARVRLAVADALLAALQLGVLLLEQLVARRRPLLRAGDLAAAQLELLLRLLAQPQLQLLGLELRLLAEGVGVALRVFQQRLRLQGVGLGPHPGELLLQEESDRSAYEKRGHHGDRNHEDVHELTSSPRVGRGMSDPAPSGPRR